VSVCARRNSRTSGQAAAPPENKAQERFGNAKSISSAQVRVQPYAPCKPHSLGKLHSSTKFVSLR